MIDSFDSRALRYVDCYGQRFMRPGEFRYNVLAVGAHLAVTERPFRITVSDRGGDQMTQHSVSLSIRGRDFVPDQPELAIALGDMVMWNCPQPAARPFAVVGDQEFFGSTNLVNESGYSHAFSAAGDYHWVDANHGAVRGLVRVRDPEGRTEDDLKRWREQIGVGTLVMIADGRVEPAEVDIVTGQTVFFIVVTGPGITITDARLVDKRASA
jgi:plastocyanin